MGGRRKDDAHDLVVREPEVAQPLPVGVGNRARVVRDLLGEVHHEVAFGNRSGPIWFHHRRSCWLD
jgi:hypothetical protein